MINLYNYKSFFKMEKEIKMNIEDMIAFREEFDSPILYGK